MGVIMVKGYMAIGWVKLTKFEELTGISPQAVRDKTTNVNYPEWRTGHSFVKKIRDGYYVNYEGFQEWLDRQPSAA